MGVVGGDEMTETKHISVIEMMRMMSNNIVLVITTMFIQC